jgi:hypothetical protein
MTATRLHRKPATKPATSAARPVGTVLLELAYLMHATRVVGQREAPLPRPDSSRSR